MKQTLRNIATGAVALLFAIAPVGVSALTPGELIYSINNERALQGLGALSVNQDLNRAASRKASDMASKGVLENTRTAPGVVWPWLSNEGYEYQFTGENIAVVKSNSNVLAEWMKSPNYRSNVLNPAWSEIGAAVASGSEEYAVVYFAKPKAVATAESDRELIAKMQELIALLNQYVGLLAAAVGAVR